MIQPEQGGEDAQSRTAGAPRGLTQRALGGMFWTTSGGGIQGAVQLLVLMALGRLLTPAEFGVMGAAAVVIAFSQIVTRIGVGPAIIQRRDLEPTHVGVAVTLSCTLGLLLGAVVYFCAHPIARFYRIPEVEPVLRTLAFLFPLDGLSTVAQSLLIRQLRFRIFVALDVGSYILGYALVGVVLAWLGFGVWSLVIANLSQVALRTVAMYLSAKHPIRPSLNLHAGRDLLGFGLGQSLAQIGAVLSQQGDNFVVGRWLGPAALGIYGRAYNLMVMPATAFGRIVNRVLFPVMAQVQDERHRLADGYERALAVVALMTLPLSAFLWVVAPEFIPVILGPAWSDVVMPFRLFTVGLLFRMSGRISDVCATAVAKVFGRALLQWAYAGMVVLGAIVGQRWGVGGVAVWVSLAMCFNWLSMAWLAGSASGLSWSRFARAHAPAALLTLLIIGPVAFIALAGRAAHIGNIPTLVAAGVGAALVSCAAWRLKPALFLGPHGIWASRSMEELGRRAFRRLAPSGASR